MATVPRVRPRARMEDMVDVVAHPPRKKLRTVETVEDEAARSRFHWTTVVAIVALAIFWAAAGPAAALVAAGSPVGWGLVGLAGSSLVVAYFMGAA